MQKPAFLAEPKPRVVAKGQPEKFVLLFRTLLYTDDVEPRTGNVVVGSRHAPLAVTY